MEQNSILKQFLHYMTANVLGMIGLSCYILADTFFVSKGIGADGLAALNIGIPVYSVINGCGLMLGMGGATKFSVFLGQKAHENAEKVYVQVLKMTAAFSVVFVCFGLFFSGQTATLLGADLQIHEMTDTYIKVLFLFAPAFLLNSVLNCFVRNDGEPKLAMTAMLAGSCFNIVMDYIFIFPLQMGIFGAVLATGFSPVVGICILSLHFRKKENHIHVRRRAVLSGHGETVPAGRLCADVLRLGVPSLITELASGIVMVVFNILILGLEGNTGVAAYGVIANISLVVTAIYTGIGQGMQPITSRLYGTGDRSGIKKAFRYAVVTMLLVSVTAYILLFVFADPVASVFNSGNNIKLQEIAVAGLKIYFTAIPFAGFNIISSIHFASVEKAVPAQTISLLRGILLVVPMAFLLAGTAGMTGVWLTYPVTELLVAVLGVLFLRKNKKITG